MALVSVVCIVNAAGAAASVGVDEMKLKIGVMGAATGVLSKRQKELAYELGCAIRPLSLVKRLARYYRKIHYKHPSVH